MVIPSTDPFWTTMRKALKGRNSAAMGLDPSKVRNLDFIKPCRGAIVGPYLIMAGTSGGHYFAPSRLACVCMLPTMGQDPSLCYIAPLGLYFSDKHTSRYKLIEA